MISRVVDLTSYELWDNLQTKAEFDAGCWVRDNISTQVDYLHMCVRLDLGPIRNSMVLIV